MAAGKPQLGTWEYVKEAFKAGPSNVPLNWLYLLGVGAGGLITLISGAWIPAVTIWGLGSAFELGYVSLLASDPRFRKYVDAVRNSAGSIDYAQRRRLILEALPADRRKRYEKLETQCTELMKLQDVAGRTANAMEDQVYQGMNKLLWIFLNLLMSDHVLETNLNSTSRDQIETEIKAYEAQLSRLGNDPAKEPIRQSLGKTVEIARKRLANVDAGQDALTLVGAELLRIEQQMQLLKQEVALGKDSTTLSASVDAIARTLGTTQDWMRTNTDVFSSGAHDDWDEAPQVLQRKVRA
ncbi:MAG: hypothetical protein ACYCW6_01490 [Candidatus Xenobia bacterium]